MRRLISGAYRRELECVIHEKLPFEQLNNCNVLLTGATGLIGTFLTDVIMYLSQTGIAVKLDVVCRDKKKAESTFEEYKGCCNFNIIEGDLTEKVNLINDYDYIIHGAGNNHPKAFAKEPVETMKVAFVGTMNLLDHLVETHRKKGKFILFSTGEVYGQNQDMSEKGCREEQVGVVNPTELRSCYPEGKRAAETLTVAYGKEYGLDIRIARLSYIFGATYQDTSSKADVQFLNKAVEGRDIVMKSQGVQYRSYCYLTDAVTGIMYILLKGQSGQVYNVSNSSLNVTIRQFAENLAEEANVKVVFDIPDDVEKTGYSRLGREILDDSKLVTLGYEGKVGIREAFQRILNIRKEWNEENV